MPQFETLLHALAAQIEVAILEPEVLASLLAVIYLEGKRGASAENLNALSLYLDLPGAHLGINHGFGTQAYAAGHRDAVFQTKLACNGLESG